MKTITYDSAPSITVEAFSDPHGVLLKDPLVILDFDSLPQSHRIDKAVAFNRDDWRVTVPPSFVPAWRPCTPGSPIVVALEVTAPYGSIYLQTSVDGVNVTDSVSPSGVSGSALLGMRFSTTLPFYRVVVAVSEPCRGATWTQQRP